MSNVVDFPTRHEFQEIEELDYAIQNEPITVRLVIPQQPTPTPSLGMNIFAGVICFLATFVLVSAFV